MESQYYAIESKCELFFFHPSFFIIPLGAPSIFVFPLAFPLLGPYGIVERPVLSIYTHRAGETERRRKRRICDMCKVR